MTRAARAGGSLTLGALVALVACGHKPAQLPRNVGIAAPGQMTALPGVVVAPAVDRTPAGLDAHVLVSVPDQGIGPFLARRGDVVMAAYIGSSSEGERRVVSVPLAAGGEARGDAKVIAPVASDATSLLLRPTGGTRPGFLAAWTSATERGEALSAVAMTDDGRPRGEPIELSRSDADIVWVGAAPSRNGAVVVWAEQTKGGDASVLAASMGSDGGLRAMPARVARNVTGWQLVPLRDGAGLALVTALPAPANAKGPKKSAITWLRLDADARPIGPSVTLAPEARVMGDVDAAPLAGGGALVGWTDVSQPDPQPVVARVDDAGRVSGPKRATDRGAGGTLVAVAPGAIAWEEPFRRGSPGRRVYLARVATADAGIEVKTPVPLSLEGRGDPEIEPVGDGLALLAPAVACPAAAPSCEGEPVLPTYVRFGAALDPQQVEPMRMTIVREPASVGWSLACGDKSCLALAVGGDASRVMTVDLARRASAFRPPLVPPPPPGAPHVEALDTVAAGVALAGVDAARMGEGTILATLSAASLAKGDEASTLVARVFGAGRGEAESAVVTKRALPVGGVAVATTDRPEDGAAIAWVGRDQGDPQVHVTRVDRHGRPMRDKRVTRVKGDASDVAITWAGDHWILAWVDGRNGDGEVYATTLDRDGRHVGAGARITTAPGDASDVSLLATPDAVWIAWADPRESPRDGFSDVYVAPLNATTAARAAEEVRVLATAAHSRSPMLAARGKDVALAWIEEAPMGADASHARSYGAMLAWLGPSGRPRAEPARLPVAGDGFPTAVTLDDDGGALHAVLARAAGDGIVLDALDLGVGGAPAPVPLLTLDGPPSLDVALALVGTQLFWNDEGPDAEAKRARRATIRWPK